MIYFIEKNKAKLRIPSPVVENNSDSTEEFKEDDELSMEEYGKDNLFYSPPKTYPKDWMYSNEIDPLRNSLEAPQIKSSTSTEFNSLDPEGLMEHMDNVVVKTIKRGRGRPRLTKKKGEFNPRSVKIKKEN